MKKADQKVLEYLKRADKLLEKNYKDRSVMAGIEMLKPGVGKPTYQPLFDYIIEIAKMILELEKPQVIWEK